jgi:hypothetical protein
MMREIDFKSLEEQRIYIYICIIDKQLHIQVYEYISVCNVYVQYTHIYIYTYDSGNYVYLLGVECGSKSTPNDAGWELIQLAPSH